MFFQTMPDTIAAREREQDHRHPQRETLELAAAIAARTLGADHSVTKALARAAQTMGKVDFWKASGHDHLTRSRPRGSANSSQAVGRHPRRHASR